MPERLKTLRHGIPSDQIQTEEKESRWKCFQKVQETLLPAEGILTSESPVSIQLGARRNEGGRR